MLMTAMLIPLIALTGSAVDIGRTYAVKTRLQQACDAGVLAGRKMMVDTSASTLDPAAKAAAQSFFASNFHSGWFAVSNVKFTPVRASASQVNGTATASVPNMLMQMFAGDKQAVSVICQARYDVADADIMFVLDTTGSMACTPGGSCTGAVESYIRPDGTTGYAAVENSGSKIAGLRAAVLSFYDTVADSAEKNTKIRYGFVTYTSTVNVGYLLPKSYLVPSWFYQTRHAVDDKFLSNLKTDTVAAASEAACNANYSRSPALQKVIRPDNSVITTRTYDAPDNTATVIKPSWNSSTNICTLATNKVTPVWRYEQSEVSTIAYASGAPAPNPASGNDKTYSTWQGCIEERPTDIKSSFDPDNLPADLDPDLIPVADVDVNGTPTVKDTRWRPMWPDIIYFRNNPVTEDYAGNSVNPYGETTDSYAGAPYTSVIKLKNIQSGYVSCGKPAERLKSMTRDQVSNYVNAVDFRAIGSTYHDTGMIWGTRLISPTGIFKEDANPNANRYIVFMTDGEMAPNRQVYGMYGMEQYDKRITDGNFGSDTSYHNARFVAECQAARARNITVFVVGFGQTLTSQLKTCASPGQAYYARDNDALKTAFQKIAQQVAILRLSK